MEQPEHRHFDKQYLDDFFRAPSKRQAMTDRAREKLSELEQDPQAQEKDLVHARHILEFLRLDNEYGRLVKSTWYSFFAFLGYPVDVEDYERMYDDLLAEADRVYTLVDPEELRVRFKPKE